MNHWLSYSIQRTIHLEQVHINCSNANNVICIIRNYCYYDQTAGWCESEDLIYSLLNLLHSNVDTICVLQYHAYRTSHPQVHGPCTRSNQNNCILCLQSLQRALLIVHERKIVHVERPSEVRWVWMMDILRKIHGKSPYSPRYQQQFLAFTFVLLD